jgi:hypothetical protein
VQPSSAASRAQTLIVADRRWHLRLCQNFYQHRKEKEKLLFELQDVRLILAE